MAFKKPKDYDNVKVGERKILPAGGYICKILKAEETESKAGKPMIKVAFDITEGDFKGYFREMFDSWKAGSDDPQSVKWPFTGTKWILLYNDKGETNRDFKSFCTALEDSGTDVWKKDAFDAQGLKDAQLGIIFRREEHEYMNTRSWRTVPVWFRSVDSVRAGDYTIPDDKPLPQITGTLDIPDSFSAAEDDIPF